METAEILTTARAGLTDMAERCAGLVEHLADTSTPIPGSEWTVREGAVHLAVGPRIVAARCTGQLPMSDARFDREAFADRMRGMFADNPETDPKKLADQIREGYGVLLEVLATLPADQPVAYYSGLRPTVADIASLNMGEPLVHGYDIATAVGAPWPIDPAYATVAVRGYQRMLYSLNAFAAFQPAASVGLEATYRVEVEGTDPLHVRITDRSFAQPEAAESVDCVVSADPVTALLLMSGRLSQWPAIALGRLRFTGARPELGPRFADLFVFP
jgi:uncharacterized protein (TIGR03083 family)